MQLTVKELIQILEMIPQDSTVVITSGTGGHMPVDADMVWYNSDTDETQIGY